MIDVKNSDFLVQLVIQVAEDVKGEDIVVLETPTVAETFDRMVIISGNSIPHVSAIAKHIKQACKEKGISVLHIEGWKQSEWVLVDLGDIIVHIMHPAMRSYYSIEELWLNLPICS